MIGHDLAGRYEIISRIGGGGMALVYKAHDLLLNRNVAVKVLRQQFVHDEEFIRRFRREAQSAAALSHPNVVSIYDVGEEEDTHYIVMEYVEGSNLNEIILERAPLQPEEAVHIAMQICDALDHAHHNHIIHRDIKPHNILIGKNGRVKVTDFGIARAVTSSTITQTGSVIGSVHYFSPEHAKGTNAGEKSDLYSLGIVLYQMVTGQLPFLGESPISVALKHLQEPFDRPRSVNPLIPQSIENIIMKAMRKNQSERYSSASEMQLDLESCLLPGRLNEPPVTFFEQSGEDLEETRIMPAIRDEAPSLGGTERKNAAASNTDTSVIWDTSELETKEGNWKKPLILIGVTILILAVLVLGFMLLLKQLDPPEVEVPDVIGQTVERAIEMLEAVGLKAEQPITREHQKDIPLGEVFDQTKKNMSVKEGSWVKLYVSSGPELADLKSYVGKSLETVKSELISLGVAENRIRFEEDFSDKPENTILEQSPEAGGQFDPEKAEFHFIVSKGPEKVDMPDLINKRVSEAQELLRASELELSNEDILYEFSYLHEKNVILSQDPFQPGEKVSKGEKITIVVSKGPPEDTVKHTFNITISPAITDQTSDVKITYSDATGQNIEGEHRQIKKTRTFPVTVILAPDTSASVTIYRDDVLVDILNISYDEVAGGKDATSFNIPSTDIPLDPPPEATQTPTDEVPATAETDGTDGVNGEGNSEGNSEGSHNENQP